MGTDPKRNAIRMLVGSVDDVLVQAFGEEIRRGEAEFAESRAACGVKPMYRPEHIGPDDQLNQAGLDYTRQMVLTNEVVGNAYASYISMLIDALQKSRKIE